MIDGVGIHLCQSSCHPAMFSMETSILQHSLSKLLKLVGQKRDFLRFFLSCQTRHCRINHHMRLLFPGLFKPNNRELRLAVHFKDRIKDAIHKHGNFIEFRWWVGSKRRRKEDPVQERISRGRMRLCHHILLGRTKSFHIRSTSRLHMMIGNMRMWF